MLRRNNRRKKTPKVISLFSGCGGLDLGFHKAGFEIVYSNDFDKEIEPTYKYNLGSIEIKDIRYVDLNSLPNADIVLAGIPCQPFSLAGKRKSVRDERGSLFNEVIKVLKLKKPKIVLFENVRGFISAKDENNIPMPERIRKELKKTGYELYYKLLNASDYQVPQNRLRVFLVGIRKDINKGFEFPEPVSKKNELVVGKVIKKPLPKDEEIEVLELPPQAKKIIKYIKEGGSWKDIPDKILPERFKRIKREMKRYRSPNFYRKFSRDEIMGTVTASATPENSGILHPLEPRRYSVREIARFQSFPDKFKFIGSSVRSKYKMIGNAVPVNLAYHMAKSISEQYFR